MNRLLTITELFRTLPSPSHKGFFLFSFLSILFFFSVFHRFFLTVCPGMFIFLAECLIRFVWLNLRLSYNLISHKLHFHRCAAELNLLKMSPLSPTAIKTCWERNPGLEFKYSPVGWNEGDCGESNMGQGTGGEAEGSEIWEGREWGKDKSIL